MTGVNFASGGAGIFDGSSQFPVSHIFSSMREIYIDTNVVNSERTREFSDLYYIFILRLSQLAAVFFFLLICFTQTSQGQAIPLSQQLKHWLSIRNALTRKLGQSKAQIHLSKSLFVVVIGSNDLLNYMRSSEIRKKSSPQQYTQSVVDKFRAQLKVNK